MSAADDDRPRPSPVGEPRWTPDIEATYRAEAPRLARFLRWRLRGSEDGQDLLHDAFVRLASANPSATPRSPEAYLQRIVRNLLLDRAKRAANRHEHVPIEPDMDLAVPPDQSYAIEADDVKRQYREAVAALPPRTREVFLLHRVDEVGYTDIAEQLGISIGTVRWHMAQAILRIGEALEG